jgi:phosphonate transport system substrate-binding protein
MDQKKGGIMKVKIVVCLSLILLMAAPLSSCKKRKGELGSEDNPVSLYFMPLKGEKVFAENAPVIQKYIEQKTGLHIKPVAAPSFLSIIKAFENNKADAAFMNTLGFLMARDWAKTQAHIISIYGDIYKSYRGEILVTVQSGINSIEDLNDKTIAFADPFSASGYLYPLKLLNENKIKPKKTVFAGGHPKAVKMVYEGKVDAACTYHTKPSEEGTERDARAELLKEYPDVFVKLKILALTDEIPNGPVAFRGNLPVEIKAKLISSLLNFAQTVNGRKVLKNLYNMTGLAPTTDKTYDPVQKVIKDLGKTVEEVVPGGVTYYNMKLATPID